MNQDKVPNLSSNHDVAEEDEVNLLELILVLAKHKKIILGSCLVTFVLTFCVTLLLPNIYSATVQILPPKGEAHLYAGMLKSRTVADAIIEKFGLREVYQEESRSLVYEELDSHVTFSVGKKEGSIGINVEDKDPNRAAEIANAYVEELKKFADRIYLGLHSAQLQFLKERLQIADEDLAQAEHKLRSFQKKNKAPNFDDQAKGAIDSLAGLRDEIDNKRIELGAALPNSNEEARQGSERAEFVQHRNQKRDTEQTPAKEKDGGDIAILNGAVPEIALHYGLLLRDFRVQAELLDFLSKTYEEFEIETANNKPNIQVLESAFAPDKKSKPKRALIVLLATLCAGFFAILIAFIREYIATMSNEDRNSWQQIKEQCRFNH